MTVEADHIRHEDVADFMWWTQAVCYRLLLLTPIVFVPPARWTAALVLFAAVFDLTPLLDFIPLVPTVMLMIDTVRGVVNPQNCPMLCEHEPKG